jgi:hypothetical protein
MLDYLRDQEKKYESLDNYFKILSTSTELKKHLLDHLCDTTVSIEISFYANKSYWQSRQKTQRAFFIMCIIMIIILFLVLFMLFYFQTKELRFASKGIAAISQSFIFYMIIYLCFSSIFIILLINIKGNMNLCKGQIEKLNSEAIGSINNNIKVGYLQYIVQNVDSMDFYKLLLQFGYKKRSLKRKIDLPQNMTTITDYNRLYEEYGDQLLVSLKNFYDDGKGYMEIRKILVLSNPINMLKEANRIMNYYNYICLNQSPNKKQPNDVEDRKIINELVINQLKKILNKTTNMIPTDDIKNNLIQQNTNNKEFNTSLNNLIYSYLFLFLYLESVYKKDITNTDFKLKLNEITIKINSVLPIDSNDEAHIAFVSKLTTTFAENYISKYPNYINLNQPFADLMPYFKKQYYDVFLHLKGNYWFPFEKDYIIDNVLKPKLSQISKSNQYILEFGNNLYTNLIVPIQNTFDQKTILKAYIIEHISNSLLSYDINISKYQNYIVNQLIKDNKDIDEREMDTFNQIVIEINQSIILKKQLQPNKNDKKFIEPQEFISLIDILSYNDLKNGLNVEYYQDIVNEFYNTISNSVNRGDNTLDNIFYNSNKNYKMWAISVALVTTILVLTWLHFTIGLAGDYKYIKQNIDTKISEANKELLDAQKYKDVKRIDIAASRLLFVNNESSNRIINLMFKIVVPVFALIFIIIMLFSYQRKSKAAFDFNSELIEANTMELKDLLDELKGAINTLEDKINPVDYSKKIEIIEVIKIDDKTEIYNLIKKIIDKFEKCNYIIEAQNSKLPFPYTEVVMNGFMIVICIGVLLYIYGQLKPFGRIYNIKELNRIKEETIYADIDKFKELKKEVEFLKNCHNDDIDTVIYTLKIMFFMFIVMFLIFYSTKIVSSTSEFKAGLFNSFYFETQTKYPL